MPDNRYLPMTPSLFDYLVRASAPRDEIVAELEEETQALGSVARMQIGPEQGPLLAVLVKITSATTVVEIGTFTGLSSLWMARALPPGGHLHCFDISEEYTAVAERYWERAGVSSQVTLHLGPALEHLDELPADSIDVAFIDADKTNYEAYVDALLPRMAPTGVMAVDNVLWSGRVVDDSITDADTLAIRRFNRSMSDRSDVDVVMLGVGDGISLITPRGDATAGLR